MEGLTKSAKDDKRKSVADDPLANGSDDHEETAEEEVCGWTQKEVVRYGSGSVCELGFKDVPISEAPFPPAPLQPMSWHDRGVRLRRKPTRALHTYKHRFNRTAAPTYYAIEAYMGVGFPNVFRRSPLTRFSGER